MTIELAVTEESKTLGQKAAQDLQSTIFATFRPKISPGVLESFRASAVIPHDTLAKLQQASMTPGLAEQLRSISAAMASPISESLAAKFAGIGRQMAHVEAIEVGPWADARERAELLAPALDFTPDSSVRDAAVASAELLESMVELQRQQLEVLAEMAQLNADAEKVVGSTELMSRVGETAAEELRREDFALVRALAAASAGGYGYIERDAAAVLTRLP